MSTQFKNAALAAMTHNGYGSLTGDRAIGSILDEVAETFVAEAAGVVLDAAAQEGLSPERTKAVLISAGLLDAPAPAQAETNGHGDFVSRSEFNAFVQSVTQAAARNGIRL